MRAFIATLLAAPLAFTAAPALAQSQNPSASQIVKSLMPTGKLSNETRGIRLAAPPPAAPPSPTQAASSRTPVPQATPTQAAVVMPPPAAVTPPSAPSVSLTVEFATDSTALTEPAKRALAELGQALKSAELATYRFRIEGHTDTVGSAAYNLALSQRRADAVAAYLESTFGIAADRLQAVGMGENGLLVPTPAQTPELRNRRVQVVNLGA